MGVTILRDLSVLWSLSHILLLFMLLYRSRYPKKTTTILTVVFMGSLALLNTAGLVKYGTELMGQVFLLTCTLPSLFFFWFMSQDKKGQFFFTFCLADTVSYWIIATKSKNCPRQRLRLRKQGRRTCSYSSIPPALQECRRAVCWNTAISLLSADGITGIMDWTRTADLPPMLRLALMPA